MTRSRKTDILRAFSRAEDYDANAPTQRVAAERLADRIATLSVDPALPALEIGCGTGFLTAALLDRQPGIRLTASDISSAMLDRTRQRLGHRPDLDFAIIDGECPPSGATAGYGLIASSLAFQWFEDPARALATLTSLLAPGGWLALTTLAADSFSEWRAAQTTAGMIGATRDYPTLAHLESFCPAGVDRHISGYHLVERHPSGLAFLRALKAIGATTAWTQPSTHTPTRLRRAIAAFEDGGAAVTYQIAEILIQRK